MAEPCRKDAGCSATTGKAYDGRPGMFMVDFYKADHGQLVTFIHELSTGKCKRSVSGFADQANGERRSWPGFLDATSAGSEPGDAFVSTEELIEKHVTALDMLSGTLTSLLALSSGTESQARRRMLQMLSSVGCASWPTTYTFCSGPRLSCRWS